MEFLKQILGDDYDLFAEKINAYNQANPDSAVLIADLSSGGYVEKSVHDALASEFSEKTGQIAALETEIKKCRFDAALDIAMTKAGAKNAVAVRALLGNIGEAEQIAEALDNVKRENPYLFDAPISTGMSQGSPAPAINANEEIRNTLFGKNK